MKRKIRKEVKYSHDEWDKVIAFAKESGKLPAAYIREKAVNGKILWCDILESTQNYIVPEDTAIGDINKVAKNVNTEKAVYSKDVEEVEKAIELLENMVHNRLTPFVFKEVEKSWL